MPSLVDETRRRMRDERRDARSYFPADESIHGLMLFKIALMQQYDLSEAFAWYHDLAALSAATSLIEKPLAGLREYAIKRGRYFAEIAPGGIPFELDAPKVVGRGVGQKASYQTRSSFVAAIDDVIVRGKSSIIETADSILVDVEPNEKADVHDNLEVDPAVFCSNEGSAQVIVDGRERGRIDEAFVSLLGPSSGAFGHWIWEYLPKYLTAVGSGLLPRVPILIDEAMPRQHRQALELVVDEGVPIVTLAPFQSIVVRTAWCAPMVAYVPMYEDVNERNERWPDYCTAPADRFRKTLDAMQAAAEGLRAETSTRIYLARRGSGGHELVNAEQIRVMLEARDFTTVYPEDLAFEGQVRMICGAGRIIGPEGSAMFLNFFARPGTRVCHLSQDGMLGEVINKTSIVGSLDVDVTVLTGEVAGDLPFGYPAFANFRVDEALLSEFLDTW